jgi:hypothetical protein
VATAPVTGVVVLCFDAEVATTSSAAVLEWVICATVDVVGFGGVSDDVAVSWVRVPLCDVDVDVEGVGSATDSCGASGAVVTPSAGTLPLVDVCAPPEDDTVTPGAISTVFDEPVSVSFVADVMVPDDELSVAEDCAGEVEVVAREDVESVEDAVVSLASASPPCLPVDDESLGESLGVSGIAHAMPAGAARADPTPNATARAPIRPTKLLYIIRPRPSNELPAVAVAQPGQIFG